MFRKISNGIADIATAKGRFSSDRAKTVLETIYKDRNSKGLQTLIGMAVRHDPPFLIKTNDHRVVDGHAEYIGVGDSSALRYLCNFILDPTRPLTTHEAEVVGSYMVSVANRYIDGCSGGPDRVTLQRGVHGGAITEATGGVYPNQEERFSHCEEEIGKELRALLLAGGTKKN